MQLSWYPKNLVYLCYDDVLFVRGEFRGFFTNPKERQDFSGQGIFGTLMDFSCESKRILPKVYEIFVNQ